MVKFQGGKLPKEDMRYFKQGAYFALNFLLSSYQQRKADITIRMIDDMKEGGYCQYFGVEDGKKVFVVAVNMNTYNHKGKKFKTRLRFPIRSMFHELVHVQQYMKNKLFDYANGLDVRYEGVVYRSAADTPDFVKDVNYWKSPWEWEAYGGCTCLWELFLLHQAERGVRSK